VEDRQLHNMIKNFIYVISFCLLTQVSFAAGDGGSDSDTDSYSNPQKTAENFVKRGKKLESKGKNEKALKLYDKAYKKLLEANKADSRNPDILNYLGFTLRKAGKYEQAEKYYLQGLEIKPDHNGINEYLGELYVQTQRMDLARERLAVLKNCNCEEYEELKEVINKN
jgi:tetratricopeptide (TPR) repeat protein